MFKGKATILLYHQVGVNPNNHTNLDCFCQVEQFIEQMKFLYESKIKVISLTDLVNILKSDKVLEQDYVVLTFDDGCELFCKYVLPILQEFNFPSTIYPVSGALGEIADWPKLLNQELKIIEKEELLWLANIGVDVGGHTVSHVKLTEVNIKESEIEVSKCKKDLESIIGKELHSFSYPHGCYNDEIEKLVESQGFECALTCESDFIFGRENLYRLPRKYVTFYDDINSFKKILNYE